MAEKTFRIVFIKKGMLEPETYEHWVGAQKRFIENESDEETGLKVLLASKVSEILHKAVRNGVINSVAFISILMLEEAKEFQREHPEIPVTLFVGRDFPPDRKLVLHESWLIPGVINDIKKHGGSGLDIEILAGNGLPRGLVIIDKGWLVLNGGLKLMMGALTRTFTS